MDNPEKIGKVFTTGEAARVLSLTRRTVTKYCEEGRITATQNRVSKRWSIRQEDLARFMRSHGLQAGNKSVLPRVLIVDDEPGIVSTITKILRKAERELLLDSATNGYEALIKIGSDVPDLIFLDIRMPGMDGRDILKAIRNSPETEKLKVVVVTGFPEEIDDMIALGADDALPKPFRAEQILRQVQSFLPLTEELKTNQKI